MCVLSGSVDTCDSQQQVGWGTRLVLSGSVDTCDFQQQVGWGTRLVLSASVDKCDRSDMRGGLATSNCSFTSGDAGELAGGVEGGEGAEGGVD